MYIEHIFQQVQYNFYVRFHHMSPLSLARENFEFSEPDFYKQLTTLTCDETRHKTYILPVGRCALYTSKYEPNFMDMHSNALTCLGKSNKKKERVPDGPTIKYSQAIQNSFIISSLASALYYMGDELASEYIIRRKQQFLAFIHSKGRMQFCRDTLMGKYRRKKNKNTLSNSGIEYMHDNI